MRKIIERKGREGESTEFVEFEVENQVAFFVQRGTANCWIVYQDGRGSSQYGLSTVDIFPPDEKEKAVSLAKSLAQQAAGLQ